jgi:hypothetical protein
MGIGASFPQNKAAVVSSWQLTPHSAEVKETLIYVSTPHMSLWLNQLNTGTSLLFLPLIDLDIVMWYGDYRRGLDQELDLLNFYKFITASNYNRFSNSRTFQFTRAHT